MLLYSVAFFPLEGAGVQSARGEGEWNFLAENAFGGLTSGPTVHQQSVTLMGTSPRPFPMSASLKTASTRPRRPIESGGVGSECQLRRALTLPSVLTKFVLDSYLSLGSIHVVVLLMWSMK